eukprot:evm.model.scf_314EXC.12 EVM.evm.TU.scf_314EXC.12   scf_314EXC:64380-71513(+)
MGKGALEQIQAVEAKIQRAQAEHKALASSLLDGYLEDREPLCARRRELVTGRATPTEAEVGDYRPAGDAGREAPDTWGPAKVPFFWARVLSNQDVITPHITRRDELALEFLEDVRYIQKEGVDGIEFQFAQNNPFFSNRILTRVLGWAAVDRGAVPIEEGTRIDWHKDRNLTLKEAGKAGGGKKGVKDTKKVKRCPSFFHFFSPAVHAADEDDEGPQVDDHAMRKLEVDEDILRALKNDVIPKAMHLYTSATPQGTAASGGEEEEDFQLVSGVGSSLESLSTQIQRCLRALQDVQRKMDEVHKSWQLKALEASEEAYSKVFQLCSERRGVLLDEGGELQIRKFWVHALSTLALGAVAVHTRDEKPLAFLVDVRYVRQISQAAAGFPEGYKESFEFEFLPNPWFENAVLKREFEYQGSVLEPQRAVLVGNDMTAIDWKEGVNLTQSQAKTGGASKPAATFFGIFKRGGSRLTFNIVGEGKDADAEAHELLLEFFQQVRDEGISNAAGLYMEGEAGTGSRDSDEEDYESEEEDDMEMVRTTTVFYSTLPHRDVAFGLCCAED